MTKATLAKRLLPALLGASLISSAHAAAPTIDLGVADGFSGFFYGNVSGMTDVEGRLAVGGNLSADGFSIGYRTPYGVTAPSVVVGGNVALGNGAIYAAPLTNVDTNATIGPVTGYTTNYNGYGVYGGKNTSVSYLTLNKASNVVDFAAAKTQLTQLSSTLNSQTANGTVTINSSGMYLTGDNTSDLEVFDVTTGKLSNLNLSNVKVGATVVINVTGATNGVVTFSGGMDGQLEALRANVLFNLNGATKVNVDTFTWGSVLANSATLGGTGHLEGDIVAQAMNAPVEIGYEPFHTYTPTVSAVPEADSYAMLLAGLGLLGFIARRRQAK